MNESLELLIAFLAFELASASSFERRAMLHELLRQTRSILIRTKGGRP